MSPFRIRGHVEAAAIREALSHHPVVELAARKSGVPREQVHEIVTESVLDMMDVLGTRYVGEMSEVVARMTRVREAIHVVYERVLTGSGETVDVGSLRQRFEELHAATQELADPRTWAEKRAASIPSAPVGPVVEPAAARPGGPESTAPTPPAASEPGHLSERLAGGRAEGGAPGQGGGTPGGGEPTGGGQGAGTPGGGEPGGGEPGGGEPGGGEPGGAAPRSGGHTAEIVYKRRRGRMVETFTHEPFPERPDPHVVHGEGSGQSEGEVLTSYAKELRDRARQNPATAAAGGEVGPWIRDNLYTGKDQTRVVGRLQEHGILEVSPDVGTVRVLEPDRYVQWVERAYRQHGGAHLDPRMREAIRKYVGTGEPISVRGTDPHSGGGSVGGDLPGTHAELLAINDLLVSGGGASPTTVATVRARTGAHFAACVHCSGVIDLLPPDVQVFIHTGRVTP